MAVPGLKLCSLLRVTWCWGVRAMDMSFTVDSRCMESCWRDLVVARPEFCPIFKVEELRGICCIVCKVWRVGFLFSVLPTDLLLL